VEGQLYTSMLGQIWGNFHSLEMALRNFLAARDPRDAIQEGQTFDALAVGDVVGETAFTDYASLGKLIAEFNQSVLEKRRIDPALVDLRDALAHGRVWSLTGTFPLRLLKFSKPQDGAVRVTWATTMTEEWLAEQRTRVHQALARIATRVQMPG
jgi:hypothetical protein